MKYAYFPGCSLKGLGRAYEESLLPVMKHLGVELNELETGTAAARTAYMAVDEAKACVLAARNLALAEQSATPRSCPCAACYLVLNKTKHYFADYPEMKATMDRALAAVGLKYKRRHPGAAPAGRAAQRRGPRGDQTESAPAAEGPEDAPYYGCQLVSPYATFDDQYKPTTMDRLLEALGASVVRYPLKNQVLWRQPHRHGA